LAILLSCGHLGHGKCVLSDGISWYDHCLGPSAVANAFTAWVEFADLGNKIGRYNDTVCNLEKLLIWWDSLGEVEQASSKNASTLITTAEHVIGSESSAWQAVASLSVPKKGKDGKGGKDGKDTKAQEESKHSDLNAAGS